VVCLCLVGARHEQGGGACFAVGSAGRATASGDARGAKKEYGALAFVHHMLHPSACFSCLRTTSCVPGIVVLIGLHLMVLPPAGGVGGLAVVCPFACLPAFACLPTSHSRARLRLRVQAHQLWPDTHSHRLHRRWRGGRAGSGAQWPGPCRHRHWLWGCRQQLPRASCSASNPGLVTCYCGCSSTRHPGGRTGLFFKPSPTGAAESPPSPPSSCPAPCPRRFAPEPVCEHC